MKPSLELAEEHFRTKVLPRRLLEKVEVVQSKSGKLRKSKKYRKATREDGGELYPYFSSNIKEMAQFGLGVSVYLFQLIIIAGVSFLAGTIMIPALLEYSSNSKGNIDDARLIGSATCAIPESINVTCNGDEICQAELRENCPLPQTNIICDIIMSILLFIIFYLNMGIEEVEDRMDEVIQTAQDYSVVVRDPPPNTRKPSDYHQFFSRFGRVKNITVTKKNKYLVQLLLQKHLILRQLDVRLHDRVRDLTVYTNQQTHSWYTPIGQSLGFFLDEDYWMNKLIEVNKKLNEEYKKVYDACRVYVSFETEAEQRLCLKELSVSILQSMSNEHGRDRIMFGDNEVLSVLESAEPNNILWENLENSFTERSLRITGAWLLSLLTMAASFYLIQETYSTHPSLVPIAIGFIDCSLPTIFLYITIFECHIDEDDKQNSLMFKLYGARLLTSVFFTYANTKWNAFLDEAQLTNILNIQLSASFVSPLIKALDLYGVTMRWIVSPLVSTTQAEMNCYWEGTLFTLADRYTEISKILFISLFYSFLVPFGLFVSTIACLVLFAVDRYLLFRKTKPPPMLDATMADSMRNYLLFAVGVHLYVTTRFIYSWPFDSATWSENLNAYVKVDKEADLMIWKLGTHSWHSEVQHRYFFVYKWVTLAVIAVMIFVFFFEPFKDFLVAFFFSEAKIETAASSSKPYSAIAGIVAYCPTVSYRTERFIVADMRKMLTRHRPETITTIPNEECNLGEMVPVAKREDLLAVVQWFSDGTESEILEEQKVDAEVISSVIKSALQPNLAQKLGKTLATPYLSMTPTSPDVVRIDIEAPPSDPSSPPKPQSTLELIAQREMEGSRIRRSIAKQKLKNPASIAPTNEKSELSSLEQNIETNEPVVFTREEVHLLRQLRKEFLALTIQNLAPTKDPSSYSSLTINFEEYLEILKQNAPDGLTRACSKSSVKSINDVMKLHRSTLRRIFLKFLATQNELQGGVEKNSGRGRGPNSAGNGGGNGGGVSHDHERDNDKIGRINLKIFLEFIQNGMIINLHREQSKQQQQQKHNLFVMTT